MTLVYRDIQVANFPTILFSSLFYSSVHFVKGLIKTDHEHTKASLQTSSPPVTSVHQNDIVTSAFFALDTLTLLIYVSLGASNFVLVCHF